ncbi:uncharacterized protein [Montipora foliosa]|uniref:uncharacterized protein n=1 Tax=Montipora foliosa TaxID=591990 RepID=UPI0035F14EE4
MNRQGNVLFWLADSQSVEGKKVQAKYMIGDYTSVLILAPHVPQDVEIFNVTNFDQKRFESAFVTAQEECLHLKRERESLEQRRLLIARQDFEFSRQTTEPDMSQDSYEDSEVCKYQ